MDATIPAERSTAPIAATGKRTAGSDLSARGEPFVWGMGGALAFGLTMITGFLALVLFFGLTTFWPRPIEVVTLTDGKVYAGEPIRSETFRPAPDQLAGESAEVKSAVEAADGYADRTLYRIGNYDLYNQDFVWVPDYDVASRERASGLFFIERQEWGPFIGRIVSIGVDGQTTTGPSKAQILEAHARAVALRQERFEIERHQIAEINREINELRLEARRAEIVHGAGSPEAQEASVRAERETAELNKTFAELSTKSAAIRAEENKFTVVLSEIGGQTKEYPISNLVRFFQPNDLDWQGKAAVYVSRWGEFLTAEPREANTEGGVMPAIVGTFTMTVLLSLFVAPFGVITALYLREYARQGLVVSTVRIAVNNLAGVPSIVYGMFGLGFFAYIVGGNLDAFFFPERLPNPTFGTGGVLWASLTLALLTVPVVIVATEEALAAVPRTTREGSLACGASKWQTIKWIILPRAAPGIMTGMILAMARGAGEVAPLMLVGVVKLAPELPVDFTFPFVHLDRSFMHLGFHIYDVGFQSRNSEAGRPMVFVTTLLLIVLVLVLNIAAIWIRNRLKKRFQGSQF